MWHSFLLSLAVTLQGVHAFSALHPGTPGTPTALQPIPERESIVPLDQLPKHLSIILDGNRRYGKEKYGDGKKGHKDGGERLTEVAKWCVQERIPKLTVYIFSTANFERDPGEVDCLMNVFDDYFTNLGPKAAAHNIRVQFLITDSAPIPPHVKAAMDASVEATKHCDGLAFNICLSYGGRQEIVNACRDVAQKVLDGDMHIRDITEATLGECMLTPNGFEPDVMIRTAGTHRLSNFLLWQMIFTELFFVDTWWPEFQKSDLLDVIQTFAARQRTFGK